MSNHNSVNPIALEDVIGCKSKVLILKTLIRSDIPLSGRETARTAGVSQRAAVRSLGELTNLGIVHRDVEPERHAFSVNRNHYLVKEGLTPLFQTEETLMGSVRRIIHNALDGMTSGSLADVNSVILMGGGREEDETPTIAILVVIRNENCQYDVLSILRELIVRMEEEFQIALRLLVKPKDVIRKRMALGDQVIEGFRTNGEVLLGDSLEELAAPGASELKGVEEEQPSIMRRGLSAIGLG